MRIGIIGCGYWGRNYVRVFADLVGNDSVVVCDANQQDAEAMRAKFGVEACFQAEELLTRREVQGIVVATPAGTHASLAAAALESNKHVLVEKPLTLSKESGERLVALAQRLGRVLMVGHTFLYNPAIRYLREFILAGRCGDIHYLTSVRTNLGPIRHDVSAIWDLAPHDVAIFNFLLDAEPQWVNAIGVRCLGSEREDAAFLTLGYPGGRLGHVHVSWTDPLKVRQVVLVGSRARAVFDDTQALEPVRVFEKGVERPFEKALSGNYGEFKFLLRDGDIVSPRIVNNEPLKAQCEHFLSCMENQGTPLTAGNAGVAVVRALEAAQRSMADNGARVFVE